jgi:predicted porin
LLSFGVTFADVTLSGSVNQAYESDKALGVTTSGLRSASGGSFLTFSGNEDLGSGLKASFKYETGMGINNPTPLLVGPAVDGSSVGNREAWARLGGDFGSLTLGMQYLAPFGVAATLDPNGANNLPYGWGPITPIVLANALQRPNVISYAIPSVVPGLNVEIQHANATALATTTVNGKDVTTDSGLRAPSGTAAAKKVSDGNGLLASYSTGGLLVGLGYLKSGDEKTTVIGGSYDLSVAKFSITNTEAKSGSEKITDTTFGISAPVGDAFSLAATAGTLKVVSVKADNMQLGGYYNLSKRTQAYALYGSTKVEGEKATSTAVGIRHNF